MTVGRIRTREGARRADGPPAGRGGLRIGIHDFSGHPFQVQLSRRLALRGHRVAHWHCPSFLTGKGALEPKEGDPEGLTIEAIRLQRGFSKYSLRRRVEHERAYGRAIAAAVGRFQPDVLISSNNPLLSQQMLLSSCERWSVPFIFWQQDIYSVAMARVAVKRYPVVGHAMGRYFQHLEASMLRRSDAVIPISEDFLPALDEWGVRSERITVIENWAPIDELPSEPRDNAWARKHGLDGRTTVLYSGTLGLKHNPILLADLAERYRETDVAVVVISEGPGADMLRTAAADRHLTNLRLLPFQPFEVMPLVFASADILVALLDSDAGVYSVPSKVMSYHCAGRPILAAVPASNLAARTIRRVRSGIVVDPASFEDMYSATDRLLADRGLRAELGARARAYAEGAFDIDRITDRFETVLSRVARSHATA